MNLFYYLFALISIFNQQKLYFCNFKIILQYLGDVKKSLYFWNEYIGYQFSTLTFMKRILTVMIVSALIGHSFAQMPANTPENVRKYKTICRENIYKEMKGMYREAGGALKYPFLVPGYALGLGFLAERCGITPDPAGERQ
jgi:hypothetical protein